MAGWTLIGTYVETRFAIFPAYRSKSKLHRLWDGHYCKLSAANRGGALSCAGIICFLRSTQKRESRNRFGNDVLVAGEATKANYSHGGSERK